MTPIQTATPKTSELYDTDFYAWTLEQAQLLRDGAWDSLPAFLTKFAIANHKSLSR